jgi:hypothetical protein
MTPDGSAPITPLDHSNLDGPLIEVPSLNLKDNKYCLFFSSNCYSSPQYDVSYATADNVAGPYTKAGCPVAPLLVMGNFGLHSPGGADVNQYGNKIAFHANLEDNNSSPRGMWVATINENNGAASIA